MQRLKTISDEFKPWNREIPWYWVAIQAAVAIAIGVYFVAAPDAATSTIRLLLAILLVVSSALDILTGFKNYGAREIESPLTPFLLVRGGAGFAIGILFFFATRANYISEPDARYILGFGLVAYALIGLVGIAASMIKGQMNWMAIATNLLFLILGAVLIYNNRQNVESSSAVRYIGWAAIAGGAILAVYSYVLKKGAELLAPSTVAATASSASLPPYLATDTSRAEANERMAGHEQASPDPIVDSGADSSD
ncbi:hypothetical protein BH23CHL5_BH23CHL5_11810 [soil metagenome]